jgi:mono/diheme cytochrome c family protein
VDAYFNRVDQADLTFRSQVGEIDDTFQSFSLTRTTPAELRRLVRARAEIQAGLRAVRAVEPPADARRIHADLVRLLTLQETAADELVRSAQFIPRFAATGKPLVAAATGLGRDLAAVKAPPPTPTGTGQQLWNAMGCGSCHTLAASGSNGKSGPSLDTVRPSRARVVAQVRDGGPKMPSYRNALTAAQIGVIASYVASAAGHPSGGSGARAAQAPTAPDVYHQYAAAFAHYRAATIPILARLDRLTAPPELRPLLDAERAALRRSVSLCTTIESDLGRHDVAAANKSIQTLFGLASGVNSAEVSRQQVAAARAYNARLTAIAKLSAAVARERQQLQTKLQ